MDYEDLFLEDRLYPWLADDSMADECYHDWQESGPLAEDVFCDNCGSGFTMDEADGCSACPECNHPWE